MSILDTISAVLNKDKPQSTPVSIETIAAKLNNRPQSSMSGVFSKYFEPVATGVRMRDIFREIPGQIVPTLKGAANLGREALQGAARTGASVGLSLAGQKEMQPPEEIKTFDQALYSVLFGQDAIESLGTRTQKAPERAKEFGMGLGNIVTPQTAPFLIPALTALDFTGAGGAAKKEAQLMAGLLSKAKQAKTAEEFVQGSTNTVFHSTDKVFDTFDTSKGGAWFTDEKSAITGKGGVGASGKGQIIESNLPKDLKLATPEQADTIPKEQLISEGYDGVFYPGIKSEGLGNFYQIFDAKNIKTKDELSSLWGEAQKVNPIKFGDSSITSSRERGFITTLKDSPKTSPEVAAKIASNYNPITNADTLAKARTLIETNPDEAYRIARDTSTSATAHSNAVAQLLVQRAQNAGNFNEAIDLVETTAKRATTQGQAIQALSMWNRLSPEGILRYAQKNIDEVNKTLPPKKQIKLTDEIARDIVGRAKKIETMVDGEEKAFETAVMINKIKEIIPATFGKKIATFQTIAQLLNPKTIIRNIGGNTAFSAIENVSDMAGAALDSSLSIITGKRSTAIPSITSQAKGFTEGLRTGIRDAIHGVDTSGVPTQFDLPSTPVFKNGVGNAAEKMLNVALKSSDRAMYKAAYDGSIYKQMVADAKTTGKMLEEPTETMMETAHFDGLYRTFQDDNAVSKAFVGIKKALNLGKDFGMGDIILKYPKTPANLLMRGIDYSPAGFVNSIFQMSRPLVGKEFNQKAFVEATARAFTGTSSLIGTGVLMHRLGIITGEKEKDVDINAVQKATGLGAYKINASALRRFVMSGMDPEQAKLQEGDVLYSYDWFQPLAIGVSIGANIDESNQLGHKNPTTGFAEALLDGVGSGANTIGEQPLIQNLTRVLKYGTWKDAFNAVVAQIPQSFVPTLLNQVNQYADNTSRNTYNPSTIQEAMNAAKRRVPGLSQSLQPNVNVWGEPMETYQNGSNNLFNIFFNPAFRTVYEPTPEADLVLDLFSDTGETKQAPRNTAKKIKVNGKDIELGPKKTVEMQQFTGTIIKNYFDQLANSPEFKQLSNDQKISHMSSVLTSVGSAAKFIILGDRPTKKNLDLRTQGIIKNYLSNPFLQTAPIVNP